MRKNRRRALIATGLVVLALVVVAYILAPSRAAFGNVAGYAAKRYAVGVFLQGRDEASVRGDEFDPESTLERIAFPLLSVRVDRAARTVTASIGGVERTAAWRDDFGSVLLLDPRPDRPAIPAPPRATRTADAAAAPWPLGDRDARGSLAGADEAALTRAVDAAFAEPAAGPKRRTRAVLVAWKGRIVAERYAAGFSAETPLGGWSMSKSVVSALIGLRVAEGRLALNAPPPWPVRAADDPRAAITLGDYLRMSSGLRWNESYGDPDDDPIRMLYGERDAGAFAADRPLVDPPGRRFAYSSGTTNVLCRTLRALCPDDADALAWPRRALFDRIGMRSAVMETDPAGTYVGSSFLFATARDWLRFGLLYAGRGVIAGERVLPADWVAASFEPAPSAPRGEYGLHWWLNRGPGGDAARRPFPALPPDVALADGFEGQSMFLVPTHDLVVLRLGLSKSPGAFDSAAFAAAAVAAFPRSE